MQSIALPPVCTRSLCTLRVFAGQLTEFEVGLVFSLSLGSRLLNLKPAVEEPPIDANGHEERENARESRDNYRQMRTLVLHPVGESNMLCNSLSISVDSCVFVVQMLFLG